MSGEARSGLGESKKRTLGHTWGALHFSRNADFFDMWSCASHRRVLPSSCTGGLHISLQPAQPGDELEAVDEQQPAGRRRYGVRKDLRECLPLQVEIGPA